jgi:Lhr-like helicase
MRLVHPLVVQIQDDYEVLIGEDNCYIHASGPRLVEAITKFKRVLVDELNELAHDEIHLGSHLQKQLQYLRALIQEVDRSEK